MVLVIDEHIDIITLNDVSKYNIDRLQISDDVWKFIVIRYYVCYVCYFGAVRVRYALSRF